MHRAGFRGRWQVFISLKNFSRLPIAFFSTSCKKKKNQKKAMFKKFKDLNSELHLSCIVISSVTQGWYCDWLWIRWVVNDTRWSRRRETIGVVVKTPSHRVHVLSQWLQVQLEANVTQSIVWKSKIREGWTWLWSIDLKPLC